MVANPISTHVTWKDHFGRLGFLIPGLVTFASLSYEGISIDYTSKSGDGLLVPVALMVKLVGQCGNVSCSLQCAAAAGKPTWPLV